MIRPALKTPRGEPRLRSLFERWLAWAEADVLKGGCLFVAAATELDDREGPARDELVRQQRDWLELIANVARTGVSEGHFDPRLDAEPPSMIRQARRRTTRDHRDREPEAPAPPSSRSQTSGSMSANPWTSKESGD